MQRILKSLEQEHRQPLCSIPFEVLNVKFCPILASYSTSVTLFSTFQRIDCRQASHSFTTKPNCCNTFRMCPHCWNKQGRLWRRWVLDGSHVVIMTWMQFCIDIQYKFLALPLTCKLSLDFKNLLTVSRIVHVVILCIYILHSMCLLLLGVSQ